jgi:tetratricopeptide (TPR) repeat protein
MRRALEGRRRVHGNNHPRTASSLDNLGLMLEDQGRLNEAETCYREGIEIFTQATSPTHPDTLVAKLMLARVLEKQKRLADAEPLYREVVAGRREALGELHADTLIAINQLAAMLAAKGDSQEAEQLWITSHKLIVQHLPQGRGIMQLPIRYSKHLQSSSRLPEARAVLEESYRAISNARGESSSDARQLAQAMAELLKAGANDEEAQEWQRRAVAKRQ